MHFQSVLGRVLEYRRCPQTDSSLLPPGRFGAEYPFPPLSVTALSYMQLMMHTLDEGNRAIRFGTDTSPQASSGNDETAHGRDGSPFQSILKQRQDVGVVLAVATWLRGCLPLSVPQGKPHLF